MDSGKEKIIIWVLAILLVLAVGYIAVGAYKSVKQKEQVVILQTGAQLGYEQAVVEILQQAATCTAVPVRYQNQTLNLIAVECLRLAQQQTQ